MEGGHRAPHLHLALSAASEWMGAGSASSCYDILYPLSTNMAANRSCQQALNIPFKIVQPRLVVASLINGEFDQLMQIILIWLIMHAYISA